MRFIAMLLASVAITGAALASGNNQNNNGGDTSAAASASNINAIVNSATGGAGGKGGEGGDVKIERGAFDVDASVKSDIDVNNRIDNHDYNKVDVDNKQHQSQSQKAYSKSGVYGSGNSSNYIDASTHNPREVASAATIYAVPSPIVCSMPRGASAQGLTFGAALSFGDNDNECDTRAAAAVFYSQNKAAMGDAIMCTLDVVREAAKVLADAGIPNACYAVSK